jgi:hypothetical protein
MDLNECGQSHSYIKYLYIIPPERNKKSLGGDLETPDTMDL